MESTRRRAARAHGPRTRHRPVVTRASVPSIRRRAVFAVARARHSRATLVMRAVVQPTCSALPNARVTRANAKRVNVRSVDAVASPTIVVKDGNDPESVMKGLTATRRAVIEDMSGFAAGELSTLLKDPDTNWQPQDWLPNPESADFLDQVRARDGGRARTIGREIVYPELEARARARAREGDRDRARNGRELEFGMRVTDLARRVSRMDRWLSFVSAPRTSLTISTWCSSATWSPKKRFRRT